MKFLSVLTLVSAALAAPASVAVREEAVSDLDLVARQSTSEEGLRLGVTCGDVVLIFARGSTEVGNMGTIIGPGLARALGRRLGSRTLTVQGVNYAALLSTNYLPGGTDLASENEMKSMLRLANTKCPNAKIVVSGYR